MSRYRVSGYESTINWCEVEAETLEEAIEKAWAGDVIEGTQDTGPGSRIWKKKWFAEKLA